MPTGERHHQLINSSFFGRISARTSLMSSKDCKMTVQLLDDSETISQEFKKNANAQVILDYICEYLNIVEKDYFGLRYQDHNKHRVSPNVGLRFRVRFYPADISVIKEEITRYQLFVQLQRDLLHGRLYCPQAEAAMLGALILQSVIGDYDAKERSPDYVSEYKLLLRQTAKIEEKIAEAHKTLKGYTAPEAELEFLKRASKLETYGFDPYTVMDKQGHTMYMGVTHRGIFIYHVNRMIHNIKWDQLAKVDYLGKEIFITPVSSYTAPYMAADNLNGALTFTKGKQPLLNFVCPSGSFAKHLWRHILSQQAFFNENDAKHIKPKFSKPRIPLFTRGSSFRFPTTRVFREIELDRSSGRDGPQPNFIRYELPRQPPRPHISTTNNYSTLPLMRPSNRMGKIAQEDQTLDESTKPLKVIDENEEAVTTVIEKPFSIIEKNSTAPSENLKIDEVRNNVMTTLSCDEELYKTKNIQPLSTAALSSTVIDEKAIKEEIFTETSADKIKLSGPNWLTNLPEIDSVRHSYYEPIRKYVKDVYKY
ncbi:unnamed protein product [Dracunculus medinensis]|uniref:FERM domain-containing protein n=1 Tax=Dracunculus medinensis TaxID=318479 RepID=A0A0N4U7I3_DRAME|nr:unnamed protein product [Dracunculus medinensis]